MGVRLDETVSKDFVAVRIFPQFRLVVAGSPEDLRARGRPRHPRDLARHECLGFRFPSRGLVYAWELVVFAHIVVLARFSVWS